jgi:threonine dehydrogenase-like Zn-dependent dehydrogenase
LREAALVEPVAVAVHDVRRAGLATGDQVAVIGAGPIGLPIALVARDAGASVFVSEVAASCRALACRPRLRVVDPSWSRSASASGMDPGRGADIAFEVSAPAPAS